MDITNEQWERIAPLLCKAPKEARERGRPVNNDLRMVLNGIFWILRTGAPWKDLPERYPPYQTCHRWFQRWRKEGAFDALLIVLAEDLKERGKLDLREAFIDGTFAPAKKGVVPLVKLSAARAPRSWQWQTLLVFLSPYTWQARRRMR
jgi:transposase